MVGPQGKGISSKKKQKKTLYLDKPQRILRMGCMNPTVGPLTAPALQGLEIIPYENRHWSRVRLFIRDNWKRGHPLTRRKLFDWQFRGFGTDSPALRTRLLLSGEEVVGMRGIIPGLYQVPLRRGRMKIVPGGSFAMWMLAKPFRGQGLGGAMHREAQERLPVITGAGSNPRTSVPIHLKNGFSLLEAMHRYLIPLDESGYRALTSRGADAGTVREWVRSWRRFRRVAEPREPDVDLMAKTWEKATFPLGIFSLYRTSEFVKWRYLDSSGYRYLFFGDPAREGCVVGRVERIVAGTGSPVDGKGVFRFIEIMPRNRRMWEGNLDRPMVALLRGVLRWASMQGCLAADFYCSNIRFGSTLRSVGFRESSRSGAEASLSLAPLFQPLRQSAAPLNALYRIALPGGKLRRLDFEDTHMVKSENDMDRPNLYYYERYL
jgi:hypothetical protein